MTVNTKALYTVLLAVAVPLACYLIVKRTSETNIHMPRHYFADSVVNVTRNGKIYSDTIWHRLADLQFTNQLGEKVSLSRLKGKVVVADFFFTHCPTICPAMALSMKRLQDGVTNSNRVGNKTPDFLKLLSISIDPERDSVPRLRKWADRFQVNPDQWWLATGQSQETYDYAKNELRLGIWDGKGVDTNFEHTDYMVLIDTNQVIRGFYHGLNDTAMSRLSEDLVLLTMEKDPKKKSFLAGKLQIIAVAFLVALLGVGIFLFVFRKKSIHADTRA